VTDFEKKSNETEYLENIILEDLNIYKTKLKEKLDKKNTMNMMGKR
jgi:hypothetical protein